MRFTLQTLNAAPRLTGFLLDILSNLVNKQVWPHSLDCKTPMAAVTQALQIVLFFFLRILSCLLFSFANATAASER